jgi:hypothetical protein
VDKEHDLSTHHKDMSGLIIKGEITMNTKDENEGIIHSSAYNPFPEPQTIPLGWNLSGILSAPKSLNLLQDKPALVIEAHDSEEITTNTKGENQEIIHSSAYDPFPEPRTIPSGWDLSGILSAPKPLDLPQSKPAPVIEADDSTKTAKLALMVHLALELPVSK